MNALRPSAIGIPDTSLLEHSLAAAITLALNYQLPWTIT